MIEHWAVIVTRPYRRFFPAAGSQVNAPHLAAEQLVNGSGASSPLGNAVLGRVMTSFLLFWVFVAASLLKPIPAIGGISIALVGVSGRIKAAFAVLGIVLTIMGATAYWRDPYGDQLADSAYLVAAQFVAMAGWIVFIAALVVVTRELFLKPDDPYGIGKGRPRSRARISRSW